MYQLHLAHALFLGLSGLSLTNALPTQEPNKAITTGLQSSTPISTASDANAAETVALAGVPKLTPDNSCGNSGNGKNKGYTCNPKLANGGACCSAYVSLRTSAWETVRIIAKVSIF
jgi:hypothetical protein